MNAQAGARQCPRCNAPSGHEARFCTGCGASLQSPACARCGQSLPEGARFCTACGAPAPSADNAPKETALASVIAGLELALYRSDPRRVLQASLDALAKTPNTEQGVVASVTAMCAYAQLGDFEQAQSCLLRARGLYAVHLGFNPQQQARFVEKAVLIDDLQEAGNRDLHENPWLYFIMGHSYGPYLPGAYEGTTEAEKRRATIEKWAEFVHDNQPRFLGALAFLYFTNGQYLRAAQHFENVLLMARRYESISPFRIELLWPLVAAGDWYSALQDHGRAAACWRRARSIELCTDSGLDDWSRFGLPWIEKAKSRLAERNILVSTIEVSRQASDHLKLAIHHQVEAEQFEVRDEGLDDLVDSVRRAGRRYTAALERASLELENVTRLDPFAWTYDTGCWWRYETAQGYLRRKIAFAHLSNEKLALAIAACKQETEIWPRLSGCALTGALQAACGLRADARATYQMCLERAEAYGAGEWADSEPILADVRQALGELGP